MKILTRVLAVPIHLYRWTLSPLAPGACRYQPTCSAYALEAIERHGAVAGLRLAVRRLVRCHPWGGEGYDPVPDASSGSAPGRHSRSLKQH